MGAKLRETPLRKLARDARRAFRYADRHRLIAATLADNPKLFVEADEQAFAAEAYLSYGRELSRRAIQMRRQRG